MNRLGLMIVFMLFAASNPSAQVIIANGDFSDGLNGWDYWFSVDVPEEATTCEAGIEVIDEAAKLWTGGCYNYTWGAQSAYAWIEQSFSVLHSLDYLINLRYLYDPSQMCTLDPWECWDSGHLQVEVWEEYTWIAQFHLDAAEDWTDASLLVSLDAGLEYRLNIELWGYQTDDADPNTEYWPYAEAWLDDISISPATGLPGGEELSTSFSTIKSLY